MLHGIIGNSFFLTRPILFDFKARQVSVWGSGPLSAADLAEAGISSGADVPLTDPQHSLKYAVDGLVNGKAAQRFVVDTGSGETVLARAAANQLGLVAAGKARTRPTFHGILDLLVGRVEAISLGGSDVATAADVTWPADGAQDANPVLGLGVLSRYKMLYDIPGKRIRLMPYQ